MPLEVLQPQLATYVNAPWFELNPDKNAVIFRANWDGATTSGSSNPRSELREMANNGLSLANWDGRSGRHKMEIDVAVKRLDGAHHVVIGQIHDKEDDVTVFRLEGNKLWITDFDEPHGHLLGTYNPGADAGRIKLGFDVFGGEVHYIFNGQQVPYTHPISDGNYFKTGCYLQKKQNSGGAEVWLYGVKVSHS